MLLNTSSGACLVDRIGRYFAKKRGKESKCSLRRPDVPDPPGVIGAITAADGDALLEDEGYTAG